VITPATLWRTRLRDALLAARKKRDTMHVSVLRSALSAIDNAETPDGVTVDGDASASVAGGVAGVGAADVARRELSEAEIRELIQAEADERSAAAHQMESGGHSQRAADLRAESAVLTDLLGNV
jgi:uncharacterized protein YqeY